ncbi:MAG TPA: hypothetical protein VM030_01520 [Acidimicrobiales bacterium]|nr:hypothetical protein [Acidimicrobiales bacterium]
MRQRGAITRMPALALSAVTLVLTGACGGGGVRVARIHDSGFTDAAARVCRAALPPLRPDLSDRSRNEPLQVADDVEDRADKLTAMVARLQRLPVREVDRIAVGEWLGDWRAYIAVGHAYARSLRTEDAKRNAEVARDGQAPQRRISAFARANEMKACALDGQPLPARKGL